MNLPLSHWADDANILFAGLEIEDREIKIPIELYVKSMVKLNKNQIKRSNTRLGKNCIILAELKTTLLIMGNKSLRKFFKKTNFG